MTMKKWKDERIPNWNNKDNEEFKKGAVLEGTYTGEKKEIQTKKGTSMLFTVNVKGGDKITVWGTKLLDSFFSQITAGTQFKLTYQGKKPSQSGNDYHDFEVEYDESTMSQDPADLADKFFKE